MSKPDEVARHNREYWDRMVDVDCEYTRPWLDLDRSLIQLFADGKLEILPEPYRYLYPQQVFRDVKGKDVLCLASAGGQQSVAFGLLGARVTVFDFCEKQLEMDQQAAAHHGYDITTVVGDMRDLSALATDSFDLVYHAISICFVPDTREVYTGVARVLRPGGIYRVGHINPATYGMEEDAWDGKGYRIVEPNYHGLVERADAKEYRHSLSDIIMGLVEKGFVLESVDNDPRHFVPAPDAAPGSAEHLMWWTQSYFALTTRLGGACK